MSYRKLLFSLSLISALSCNICCGCRDNSTGRIPGGGDPGIRDIITEVASDDRIVGMGAGIVTVEGDPAVAVCGYNRAGSGIPVRVTDLWHIGSCTKAMTATLAARAVKDGSLRWNSTLAELFPEISGRLGPVKGGITLEQLLSHRSGLPYDPGPDLLSLLLRGPREQREAVLRQVPGTRLESAPGKEYHYSNFGYSLAGLMIEKVEEGEFEDIMHQRLFEPLGMEGTRFEGEVDFDEERIIWPHHPDGTPVSRWKRPLNDYPAICPAGCVRCSLRDWARFIRSHLVGEEGGAGYLSADSYRQLHRSRGDNYALGWVVLERDWGGGAVLQHAGSNGWNYSVVWIAPNRGFAVFVCANQGDCYESLDRVAGRLIELLSGN
ncbi:MAG: serine hydrolase [Candidatus Latescibacteria bacterium]|nr:serine hydrolase [bacterium]MBD3425117.1 serine hydrolase [Candidatus Latescibacterota bacterium]